MGGHGGLNILPQKQWNVYRHDNREKVRRDEEAAAKEDQLKREQSRRRDTESRLSSLRQTTRLLSSRPDQAAAAAAESPAPESSNHINLFEGIRIFDPVTGEENTRGGGLKKMKMTKKEEEAAPRAVTAEDEKFRLGYGVAGKGVKLPWYLSRKPGDDVNTEGGGDGSGSGDGAPRVKSSGKKTIEELREERLERERREKERERALVSGKRRSEEAALRDRRNSRRGLGWQ